MEDSKETMRLIDFFMYYVTTLYKNKPRGNLYWDSPVRRTCFVVGLTFCLFLFLTIETAIFLIARINLFDIHYSEIIIIVVGVLIIQLLAYIYIKRNRYHFITSSKYKAFTLSNIAGVTITVGACFLSFILLIAVAVAIGHYLKSHRSVEISTLFFIQLDSHQN